MNGKPFIQEPNRKICLKVRLLFSDVYKFRKAFKDLVIQEGFEIIRIKNERARLTIVCAACGCCWHTHASLPLMVGCIRSKHTLHNIFALGA